MDSSRKNKTIYIDQEALATLALVHEGLLKPIDKLMDQKDSLEIEKNQEYKGIYLPFSFILAPKGKRNQKILQSLKNGDIVHLINNNKKVGEIKVKEIFKIDPKSRLFSIYGTNDSSHPGVKRALQRLGEYAISGEFWVDYPPLKETIKKVKNIIEKNRAQNISAMMLAANPLNRAHERMIRQTLGDCDLLLLFLRKPFVADDLSYEIRYNSLKLFIENFLPKNRVFIVPFENTYIFGGYTELIFDALLAKNYGATKLVIGKNHAGLGMFYNKNRLNTIFDKMDNLGIKIEILDEFVYCDTCKTLVNSQTCPHGQHHHIHYHSKSILKLIKKGILPPPILVRKEISANIISALFPNRIDNLEEIYYSLMPSSGLIEKISQEEFYIKLMELYQTTSLT